MALLDTGAFARTLICIDSMRQRVTPFRNVFAQPWREPLILPIFSARVAHDRGDRRPAGRRPIIRSRAPLGRDGNACSLLPAFRPIALCQRKALVPERFFARCQCRSRSRSHARLNLAQEQRPCSLSQGPAVNLCAAALVLHYDSCGMIQKGLDAMPALRRPSGDRVCIWFGHPPRIIGFGRLDRVRSQEEAARVSPQRPALRRTAKRWPVVTLPRSMEPQTILSFTHARESCGSVDNIIRRDRLLTLVAACGNGPHRDVRPKQQGHTRATDNNRRPFAIHPGPDTPVASVAGLCATYTPLSP